MGWPDKWETGVEWELEKNYCRWCPESGNGCGVHHQSPIDLKRSVAVEDDEEHFNECIDVHWMQYYDSTCSFHELKNQNAFIVDRHALKIVQPTEHIGNDRYRIGCRGDGGRRWGKIDFSKVCSFWKRVKFAEMTRP